MSLHSLLGVSMIMGESATVFTSIYTQDSPMSMVETKSDDYD